MSFYDEMALVTAELLSSSVFGQGLVVLKRETLGQTNTGMPWVPAIPETVSETLKAAVAGAGKYANGVTILSTDFRIVAAVPIMDWRMGDDDVMKVEVDGKILQVVQTEGLPAAGTPAAIVIIARN